MFVKLVLHIEIVLLSPCALKIFEICMADWVLMILTDQALAAAGEDASGVALDAMCCCLSDWVMENWEMALVTFKKMWHQRATHC